MIRARADGWAAAPNAWLAMRIAMSAGADGAMAVITARTTEPARLIRNSRRCPKTSPIFPNTGVEMAITSMGPVMAHSSTPADTP